MDRDPGTGVATMAARGRPITTSPRTCTSHLGGTTGSPPGSTTDNGMSHGKNLEDTMIAIVDITATTKGADTSATVAGTARRSEQATSTRNHGGILPPATIVVHLLPTPVNPRRSSSRRSPSRRASTSARHRERTPLLLQIIIVALAAMPGALRVRTQRTLDPSTRIALYWTLTAIEGTT